MKNVFKKSKHSRWAVRKYIGESGHMELYGCHVRCARRDPGFVNVRGDEQEWSWFKNDTTDDSTHEECYYCGSKVPEYIQALVQLTEWDKGE